jgi:DNA gyrase subunit A
MGRATSGVTGMKFRDDDELLSMSVIRAGSAEPVTAEEDVAAEAGAEDVSDADDDADEQYVFTVTDAGWAKRSKVSAYRVQGRGGLGIKAMKLQDRRGQLVGAIVVSTRDEVLAIRTGGQVTRSAVADVPVKGRDTMGVKFVGVQRGDSVIAIARNVERAVVEEELEPAADDADAEVSVEDVAETVSAIEGSTETDVPVTGAEQGPEVGPETQEDSDG